MNEQEILPLWGMWQRTALTEGDAPGTDLAQAPSTTLRVVPLLQWGRN